VCLPPELPLASIAALSKAGREMGVAIEVWGHGKVPLAISGRCYHARLNGRSKDNCQFACEDDPDGLAVDTLDGARFLTVNGVQTLSQSQACAAHHVGALAEAGVAALRLSPATGDFAGLCGRYRALLDGEITADALTASLMAETPGLVLSDGFLTGAAGADWSAAAR
jgi:collagenase-like PrtC family protease